MLSACRPARLSRRPSSDNKANTSACRSAEDHLSEPSGTPSLAGTHSNSSATNYVESPLCLPCLAEVVLRIRCSNKFCPILLPPSRSPRRTKVICSTVRLLPTRQEMARSQFCKRRPRGLDDKLLCLVAQSNRHSAHSKNTSSDHRFR